MGGRYVRPQGIPGYKIRRLSRRTGYQSDILFNRVKGISDKRNNFFEYMLIYNGKHFYLSISNLLN